MAKKTGITVSIEMARQGRPTTLVSEAIDVCQGPPLLNLIVRRQRGARFEVQNDAEASSYLCEDQRRLSGLGSRRGNARGCETSQRGSVIAPGGRSWSAALAPVVQLE